MGDEKVWRGLCFFFFGGWGKVGFGRGVVYGYKGGVVYFLGRMSMGETLLEEACCFGGRKGGEEMFGFFFPRLRLVFESWIVWSYGRGFQLVCYCAYFP